PTTGSSRNSPNLHHKSNPSASDFHLEPPPQAPRTSSTSPTLPHWTSTTDPRPQLLEPPPQVQPFRIGLPPQIRDHSSSTSTTSPTLLHWTFGVVGGWPDLSPQAERPLPSVPPLYRNKIQT